MNPTTIPPESPPKKPAKRGRLPDLTSPNATAKKKARKHHQGSPPPLDVPRSESAEREAKAAKKARKAQRKERKRLESEGGKSATKADATANANAAPEQIAKVDVNANTGTNESANETGTGSNIQPAIQSTKAKTHTHPEAGVGYTERVTVPRGTEPSDSQPTIREDDPSNSLAKRVDKGKARAHDVLPTKSVKEPVATRNALLGVVIDTKPLKPAKAGKASKDETPWRENDSFSKETREALQDAMAGEMYGPETSGDVHFEGCFNPNLTPNWPVKLSLPPTSEKGTGSTGTNQLLELPFALRCDACTARLHRCIVSAPAYLKEMGLGKVGSGSKARKFPFSTCLACTRQRPSGSTKCQYPGGVLQGSPIGSTIDVEPVINVDDLEETPASKSLVKVKEEVQGENVPTSTPIGSSVPDNSKPLPTLAPSSIPSTRPSASTPATNVPQTHGASSNADVNMDEVLKSLVDTMHPYHSPDPTHPIGPPPPPSDVLAPSLSEVVAMLGQISANIDFLSKKVDYSLVRQANFQRTFEDRHREWSKQLESEFIITAKGMRDVHHMMDGYASDVHHLAENAALGKNISQKLATIPSAVEYIRSAVNSVHTKQVEIFTAMGKLTTMVECIDRDITTIRTSVGVPSLSTLSLGNPSRPVTEHIDTATLTSPALVPSNVARPEVTAPQILPSYAAASPPPVAGSSSNDKTARVQLEDVPSSSGSSSSSSGSSSESNKPGPSRPPKTQESGSDPEDESDSSSDTSSEPKPQRG